MQRILILLALASALALSAPTPAPAGPLRGAARGVWRTVTFRWVGARRGACRTGAIRAAAGTSCAACGPARSHITEPPAPRSADSR